MNAAVGLMDGLGLDGDQCIRVIPRHPPFSMKEEAFLKISLPLQSQNIILVIKGPSNRSLFN